MTEEHALVRADVVSLGTLRADTPDEMVASATRIAKPLAEVIESQRLFTMIGGRKHVRVEGWTTVAMMCGATVYEVSNVAQEDGTYVATVELRRLVDGQAISRASAECGGPSEPMWQSRPQYARRSMAATRAASKSCRLALSWIMTLSGYDPTPAEEMHDEWVRPDDVPAVPPTAKRTAPEPVSEPIAVTPKSKWVYVQKVDFKDGVAKTGKPWKLWIVKTADGRQASTFDEDLAKVAQRCLETQRRVEMLVEPGKKEGSWNLVELTAEPPAS